MGRDLTAGLSKHQIASNLLLPHEFSSDVHVDSARARTLVPMALLMHLVDSSIGVAESSGFDVLAMNKDRH